MLQVIKTALLSYVRHTRSLMFNLFFPVFLVVLLGTTLQNNFDSSQDEEFNTVQVLYIDNGNDTTKQAFNALKALDKTYNLNFVEEKSEEIAMQKVRVASAVFLHLEDSKINFYANDRYLTGSSIVLGALKGITNSINAEIECYKVNPKLASSIETIAQEDLFNIELISQEKSPSAKDYYGVVQLGLMMFYYFSLPMYYLKEERKSGIKDRIKLSGLSMMKYYFASFIGYSIAAYATICASYLMVKYIVGVNYGDNIFLVPLAALPFITFIISFGILLALVLKDEEKGEVIGNSVIIPVLCFLGGAYVPLKNVENGLFNIVTKISPLRWFNNGLFGAIYGGDNSLFNAWMIVGGISTVVCLVLVFIVARRREIINE